MEKKQCGECKLDIHDLEPMCCGLCESFYHISQQCCGLNVRPLRDALMSGKTIFICSACRTELNGRSIRAYFANNHQSQSPLADLPGQVQQLFDVVADLSKKIDDFADKPKPKQEKILSGPPVWPRLGMKRRREDRMIDVDAPVASGTKAIDLSDLSDLSVPSIVQPVMPEKFWLYISGLNPQITDNDIQLVVSRCLKISDPATVVRLVPKGKDVSNITFVSYKVGLDPGLKESALDPASWPFGMRFREFVELRKN